MHNKSCFVVERYLLTILHWRRDGISLTHTMATATVPYGTMREYDPDTKSIFAYLERLQLYFESNDIANAKKVSVLLTVIGPKVYSMVCSEG